MSENSCPVLCFGEVLLRVSAAPGHPFASADKVDLTVGGAEANVAAALGQLGVPAKMVSTVPDNPLGNRAVRGLAASRVDVSGIARMPGRMGLYFYQPPVGSRAGEVIYDRAGSAFSNSDSCFYDFAGLLGSASLLHISGITPALGPHGVTLVQAAAAAARKAAVPVSLDGNFRASLWREWGGDPAAIMRELAASATILFGNYKDIGMMLGEKFSSETEGDRAAAAQAAFDQFPGLKLIASTQRTVHSASAHSISARIDTPEAHWESRPVLIEDVVDRIGTGDAFAAGVLMRWREDATLYAIGSAGLALSALKHGQHGDMLTISRSELERFDANAGDVAR
ncbi:MAG: sugar kinase [Erythrobacter sp.]|uniref:sugar kinase n=1 Tax=Erythrobacter sp. TaxID=1042 RepID=UPI0026228C4F|nr:sugar kinase [Erythrobacter sp.]MDJ0978191.1 sugar kinase [Erythrobacter sp.]